MTFHAGETVKTISVPIIGDTLFEGDESFSVQLLNPVNATIDRSIGIGTIVDDDQFGVPQTLVSSIDNVIVTEGNSGLNLATFTLRLSTSSTTLTTVRFQTQDVTATANSDYLPINTSIAFQPGETLKTFTIAIIGDTVYEPDETFNVVITGADNATFSTTPASCKIVNDDAQFPPRHRAVRH